MVDNRGIDTDPGWFNRQLQELRRQIEALRSERRAAATEITEGDFTVSGGGRVRVKDGGGVTVEDGGSLIATYADETAAAYFGALVDSGTGAPWGHGLLVQDPNGDAIFWAGEKLDGTFEFVAGPASNPAQVWHGQSSAGATLRGETGLFLEAGAAGQVQIGLGSAGCFIGHGTTSSAANAYIDPNGFFARVTSSRRYKEDIRDVSLDADTIAAIFQMRPRTWRDKTTERDSDNPTLGRRHIGFIAEELDALGLRIFVVYDEEGRPDAIQYDRLCVALLAGMTWLRERLVETHDRVQSLEAQLAAQQTQIDNLAARVAALE